MEVRLLPGASPVVDIITEQCLYVVTQLDYNGIMVKKKCVICKKVVYVRPSHAERGWGKYCSRKCQYQGYKTGKYVKCSTCGEKTYKAQSALCHSKSKKYFCDKSCFAVWKNTHLLIGENHPSWKNGEGSYREIILRSGIKPICRSCKIVDIRVLLTHHIDGNRQNNKVSNLEWLCRNCHYLVHNRKTI